MASYMFYIVDVCYCLQYQVGGGVWTSIVTEPQLLNSSALLRFLPVKDFFGTATIMALAWDGRGVCVCVCVCVH